MRTILRTALVLAVAAVSAAAGWTLRAAVTAEDPPPLRPARVVALGPASLRTPAGWVPERVAAARLPGLDSPTAAFATAPGLDAHVLLTVTPVDHPSLIAAPLRRFLGPPGSPSRRPLAGLPAWAYPPRAVAGGRTAEVTVAPTSAGVVTVTCIAESSSWVGAAGCADHLTRGSLVAATAIEPGPDIALRGSADGVLGRLGTARRDVRSELSRATGPPDVQRLALRLAGVHETAAASLTPAASADRSLDGLVRNTRSAARLYRRLARAAATGHRAAYERVRAAIMRADRGLERAASTSP